MKFTSRATLAALALPLSLAMFGGSASVWAAPPMVAGGVYVGANSMTLYTFDTDVGSSGKSMCRGPCAANWPPFMATDVDAAMGSFSIITRDDGKKQWAVNGKPVYYWAKDSKPGDKTGDGVNKVWHTAKP